MLPLSSRTWALLLVFHLLLVGVVLSSSSDDSQKEKIKNKKQILPKDPLFITDIDLENLYDEWEDSDEEKLPDDELPAHKRPPPAAAQKIVIPENMGHADLYKDPEKLMEISKKGKTVMAFVNIANEPTREQTDELTQRWQVGLNNNHIKSERYVIADDRAIFVFHDGAQAFEAKEFILEQPEVKEYSIDQRTWQGKGYPVESCSLDDGGGGGTCAREAKLS